MAALNRRSGGSRVHSFSLLEKPLQVLSPCLLISILIPGFAPPPGSGPAWAEEASSADIKTFKKELAQILKDKNTSALANFVKKVAKFDDAKSLELLVRAAVALPSYQNYQTAVKTIARISNEETIDELIKRSADAKKEFRQRHLILEAFGHRKDEKTLAAILAALQTDKNVQVRIGAIRACVIRKDKNAIPELITHVERNEKERNRDWIEARQALLELTAQDFELVADWRNFWELNKATLDPRNLKREKDGPTRVVAKKTDDSVELFGKEIFSQNVVFVVDCSGSMIIYDEDPDYTGDNIEFDRRRLERAKDQMIKVVRKLRSNAFFNIITYNSQVFQWQKRLVLNKPGNRTAAQKFVKGFQSAGLTHTDDALEKAFEDLTIDTIVLLSDGAPFKQGETGDFIDKILKRVKDLNASRKLRIDTFGFEGVGRYPKGQGGGQAGGGADSAMVKFLQDLAEQNGGEYRAIK